MVKVGVYCRLSDEDRYKKNKNDDSESIVNQKSMLLKYALDHNWEVIDIYSDDDYSGGSTDRPEFQRLINDCELGRINLVLCKTQSRFSRDIEVIEKYLHNKFIEWGVRFVSIVDNADTDNISNKKSRQINGLINEWYLEDLSQNIRKSLKNKREDGLWMGSFAPYGYKRSETDKHKLEIDEYAANIVRKIFELYKDGYGYNRICQYLNEKNILPPAEYKKSCGIKFICGHDNITKKWTMDTIAKLLKNEVYIGNLVQGKTTYVSYKIHKQRKKPRKEWDITENAHDPIIDLETWNIVKRRFDKREKPIKSGEIHILSQKVYCATCGRVFARNLSLCTDEFGNKVKTPYLHCKGHKYYHSCTNGKSIRYDVIENHILDSINNILLQCNKDRLRNNVLNEIEKQKDKRINPVHYLLKEKESIEKKLSDNHSYLKNLYSDKMKGIISEDDFQLLREEYSKDVEIYQSRLNDIEKELQSKKEQKNNQTNLDHLLSKYNKIEKLTKIIIDEFVEKVYVGELDPSTNSREIKIVWNFSL